MNDLRSELRMAHPRPDFTREHWHSLEGTWAFAFDDEDVGLREGWQHREDGFPMEIRVPFAYQSELSGIGTAEHHPVMWYQRPFEAPAHADNQRVLLHFGAVDYACRVYVNGQMVARHRGGYLPFSADITPALRPGRNSLSLRVVDTRDTAQPRGKQYWDDGLFICWYTPCSGIWQSVYMEIVGDTALRAIYVTPDIDRCLATVEVNVDRAPKGDLSLCYDLYFEGQLMRSLTSTLPRKRYELALDMRDGSRLDSVRLWSPDTPHLYDLVVTLRRGEQVLDRVATYFGMRKVSTHSGHVLLNNMPLYQRLVLDQGYWPQSLMTPPDNQALKRDVELIQALGFNGVRMHQKIEDPRFYYWCDRLGLLCWGELPSAYEFCRDEVVNLTETMTAFIQRDFNHPSIITWVPLNESWGAREIYENSQQQRLSNTLFQLCKAMDPTRLVIGNDGWEMALSGVKAGQLEGSAEVEVPVVRAGAYHIDVIARSDRGVEDFASVAFSVISPRGVGVLELDEDWGEVGSYLRGKVSLSGEPGGADERLVVSLLDHRGRELMRDVSDAAQGEGRFRFRVEPWLPMLVTVRASLVQGTDEVSSAWAFANVTRRNRGQFNFLIWDVPSGTLAPYAERSLARSGVTLQLGGGAPPKYAAANDIAWNPYTTHVGAACKPVCWSADDKIQSHVDGIVEKQHSAHRHGVFVYSLGDEIVVRGSCLSPHCLETYRGYLKQQYENIGALNASWGSDYADFNEVQLSKPDDNDEAEALRAGNFPRWFDRQAFQSDNFSKLCERFGAAFRRIDPQSRCGFEGAGRFAAADDLDGFVRSNSFWSPYPGTADEVLRSIAPRDFPRSNWIGYTKDADTLLEKYWRIVTRGCDAVWWWRWDALGRFHGWLAPNLDPFPAVQEILRDTQIVRDGLGDLLLSSEMQTDDIGILYSLSSAYAAKVQASPSFGSYESNHAAFHNALRELGLNFQYFTDRQMRLGEVDLSQFKVILLPLTQAMGGREAEMLRAYVREGGMLIADVRPAIHDGHVKPLADGQLDDVFGAKRTGFADALVRDAAVPRPSAAEKLQPLVLPSVRADAGIQATAATTAGSAGEVPLLLHNAFGKGQAMLLNLAMSSFPALGGAGTPEAAAQLVQQALGRGGVRPPLRLTGADGQRLRNVEITRWNNGPVRIVSVFRHHGHPEAATLTLPETLHVYDLKARKDLGKRPSLDLTVVPYRAMFYALSPQPLGPVEMKMAPSLSPGGVQRVTITSVMPEGRQAVKLEVKRPDGSAADWADTVVVTDKQGIVVDVPVAYNDARGAWTVHATELYTGTTATAQFTVK